MSTAALPAEPLTWSTEHVSPLDTIPPEARALYEQQWCSALEASDFLGYKRHPQKRGDGSTYEYASHSVTRRLQRYERRILRERKGGLITLAKTRPEAGELAGHKIGTGEWAVDARWLVAEKHPQVSPW